MIKLPRPMKMGLIASATIAATALAWISATQLAQAKDESTPAKTTKAALTVTVTQATRSDWPLTLSANGSIAAWQETIIGAEVSGLRLEDVQVNVGDRVRKGQLLARLQSDTVAADLEQTRASLQEAEATLAEASANADRARQLQSSGAMSAQQITQLTTAELTAKARLSVLKARIKADEIRLAQTRVLAPDDGSISARMATLGAVVQPGQELFRLIRRDRLEWRAEVPSSDLQRLKAGMKATVFTASGSSAQGTIRTLAPTVDAQTRNGLVFVDLTQTQDARAGMFARGEIQLGNSGALTLPQSAVQMRDGFHYVYRVNDDSKIAQTKVTVGRRSGERIEITGGVDASQKIVDSGVGFLADGDTVRVVATPEPIPAAAATTKSK